MIQATFFALWCFSRATLGAQVPRGPPRTDFGTILVRFWSGKLTQNRVKKRAKRDAKSHAEKRRISNQFGLIFHRFLNNFQSHLATHARHFSKLSCKPALSKPNGKPYGSASKMTYSQDRLKLQIQQNSVLQTPKNDIENTCQKRQECGPNLG